MTITMLIHTFWAHILYERQLWHTILQEYASGLL